MKIIITCTLFIVFFIQSYAQENEYKKLISKYDVKSYITNLDNNDISSFWNTLTRTNPAKLKFEEKMESKLAKKSFQEIANSIYKNKPYIDNLHRYDIGERLTKMLHDTICGKNLIEKVSEICIIPGSVPNAYSTPIGGLYITESLMDMLEYKDDLIGVFAHEMAHYQLQHALIETYNTLKRERNNRIAAAISSGVVVAAEGYSQASSVGVTDKKRNQERWGNVQRTVEGLANAAKSSTERYHYKYSREQEIEADIIAFRFLEWVGLDRKAYIYVLKAMKEHTPEYIIDYEKSEHPSIDFRIGLLEYLDKNETE